MREIKFRGKRKDTGEWVYGDFLKPTDYHFCIRERISGATHYVESETVGQYTGLKDKNGKEIYGGDRVKIQDEVVTIFFNESMASWDYEYEGGDCEPIVLDGSYYDPSGFEVIGNIHEE